MRRVVWMIGLAACGGKGGGGSTTGGIDNAELPPVGQPRDVSFESFVECPAGLAARYDAKIEEEPGDANYVRGCLAGHFGDAVWLVYVESGPTSDQAETGTSVYLGLIGPDGSDRAFGSLGGYDWMSNPPQPRILHDFDGDGVEEIVILQGGPGWSGVQVARRAGATIEAVLDVPYTGETSEERDGYGPDAECEYALRVDAPATLVVTTSDHPDNEGGDEGDGDPYGDGPSCGGEFRYTWSGAGFAFEDPDEPDEPDEGE